MLDRKKQYVPTQIQNTSLFNIVLTSFISNMTLYFASNNYTNIMTKKKIPRQTLFLNICG